MISRTKQQKKFQKKKLLKKRQKELFTSDGTALFLLQGMIVRTEAVCQEESRAYTLLLKGVLVYLTVMGGMGCFLSALEMNCAWWVVHLVVLSAAIFCAMLYYNKRWENTGYCLLLLVMLVTGNGLNNYINSGFYSVANAIAEAASDFFATSAIRTYGEQVGNRYMAVTVSMCFIGCVCCILMNILLSRRMQYLMAIPLSIGILLVPLYLELEPDGLYVAMLLTGLFTAYIIRGNGHYRLTKNNDVYEFQGKKKRISYVYESRTVAGILAAVFLVCFLLIQFLSLVYPKEQFRASHTMSKLKKSTMDTVENISLLGIMGLFNFYPNTGGLTSGTLGGVSSVRLDFETDLTIEFAPYSDERLYFKTFTGGTYLPYQNKWSRLTDGYGRAVVEEEGTVRKLKERYEGGGEYSARGVMKITNVAAAVGIYLPYYSEDIDKEVYPGRTVEYTYYPHVSNESLEMSEDGMMELWLEVPKENLEVIAAFVKDAELSAENTAETVEKLTQYYQDNIPYTLRPGLTPYRKDFVNYFLAENRRGYCAHFASAATLIFRYLGIPARYVEGYAIDPTDITERGTLVQEEQYTQYYDGYSPLGMTAVVSVDATDANAHAWVEIYDKELGWQVVEVTPASEEEDEGESLWQRLMNFFAGNQDEASEEDQAEDAQGGIVFDEQTRRTSLQILVILIIVLMAVFLCRRIAGKALRYYRYCQADRNGKLIMRYQEYIRRVMRKQKGLTDAVNYEQQLLWLADKGIWEANEEEVKECIRILERAGFSQTEVSEQEFERVLGHMTH